MPNANRLRNHTGMVRDVACFFFREEEARRETGLRREAVLVLGGMQIF
jgi:hypothetical protein